jgi:hypothetical protein
MWRHNTQAAGRLVLACQPVSVPIGRQGAHLLASCPWHPGPRRRAPLPLSHGVPSHSRALAGPTRTGTELALPMGRPGGRAITGTSTPPRGVPEGRQSHGARQGRPCVIDRHEVTGMDQGGEAGLAAAAVRKPTVSRIALPSHESCYYPPTHLDPPQLQPAQVLHRATCFCPLDCLLCRHEQSFYWPHRWLSIKLFTSERNPDDVGDLHMGMACGTALLRSLEWPRQRVENRHQRGTKSDKTGGLCGKGPPPNLSYFGWVIVRGMPSIAVLGRPLSSR